MRCLLLSLCAVFTLFLSACGSGGDSSGGEKILVVGNGAEPQDLDPQIVTGVPEHHIIKSLIEGLVTDSPEGNGISPGMAESWETSADGLTWTFHIRQNAVWTNGDPVTADDFVQSYKRFLSPKLASAYASFLYVVQGAQAYNEGKLTDFSQTGFSAPDAHTLIIKLRSPTPFLLESMKHYAWFPVNIATVKKFGGLETPGSEWTKPGNFVGNGPFNLVEWNPNQYILVKKSKTYWNAANTKLDGIRFMPIDNPETEERMFRTGQLHITNGLPIARVPTYREKYPDEFRSDDYYSSSFIRINTRRKPLDDVRVRKALALAIDREAYVKLLKGGQKPAYAFTPDSATYHSEAQLQGSIEDAQRLLAEAGYPGGKGFPHIEYLYVTSNDGRLLAEVMQAMWKKNLGIDVTLHNEEWKVYLSSQDTGNYDLARAGWTGDYPDPHTFLSMWVSYDGNNQTGYNNPDYDHLLLDALKTTNNADRMAIYQKLDAFIVRDLPVIPINYSKRIYAIKPVVKNWVQDILDNRGWQFIDLAPSS